MAVPVGGEGRRGGNANLVPGWEGRIEAARNDPMSGSGGSGLAAGVDRFGHGRMAVPLGGGGATRVAMRTWCRGWEGRIEAVRNDPMSGSGGSGLAAGVDRFGHGRMAVPVGSEGATGVAMRTWCRGWEGRIEAVRNDPMSGSGGSGLAAGVDRFGHGRMAVPVGGEGAAGVAMRIWCRGWEGRIEAVRNDPIRGSAGSWPATSLGRLGARQDGGAARWRRGNQGGDTNLVPG